MKENIWKKVYSSKFINNQLIYEKVILMSRQPINLHDDDMSLEFQGDLCL